MFLFSIAIAEASKLGRLPTGVGRYAFDDAFVKTLSSPDKLNSYLRFLSSQGIVSTQSIARSLLRRLVEQGPQTLSDHELIQFSTSISSLQALEKRLQAQMTSSALAEVWWKAFSERAQERAESNGLQEVHQAMRNQTAENAIRNSVD